METIRILWNNRDRTIPIKFVKKAESVTNHWGVGLQGFWMPNMYGSGEPYVTFHLQHSAVNALESAFNEALERGYVLILTEAYRTYEVQQKAHQDKPHLAVSPEVSKHPRGLAVDMWGHWLDGGDTWDESDKESYHGHQDLVADILVTHNFFRTVMPKEPWHFDFKGEAS